MAMRKNLRLLMGFVFAGCILFLSGCSEKTDTLEETEPNYVHDTAAESIAELSYDAGDAAGWNGAISENEISKDFSKALSEFSFEMAGNLLHDTEENEIFSPFGIYYTLAMAESGAGGATKEQLDTIIRMKNSDETASECRKLMLALSYGQQRYAALAKAQGISGYRGDITLAGSLWFSRTLEVKDEYLEMAAKNFYAPTYAVNFENPDSIARMQYWVRDMTDGEIYPRFSLPSSTLLVLLNALHFYGPWDTPFSEEDTAEDSFTLEDGWTSVTASYLCRTDDAGKINMEDGCRVSALSTYNGCELVILLPDDDRTVDEFLETPDKLKGIMDKDITTDCSLKWKIPKFSFGSGYKLPTVLKKMGVTDMFSAKADLSGISDSPLFVSDVLHEAHISIDENGVEGAAYTLMAMMETALSPSPELREEMICDHPFIFGVREKNTGVWLFLGVCRNPSVN